MGTATDDQAGSAAAVEEITYELGAVLGITFLGSLVGAVYRAGLPEGADAAVRESVAGAVGGPSFGEAADAFVVAFASVGAVGAVLDRPRGVRRLAPRAGRPVAGRHPPLSCRWHS